MHKFHLGIVTFVFAIASAHAGPPATSLDAVAVRDNAHLVIDCGAERLPGGRAGIGRQEQWTPELVLADVNTFVQPDMVEHGVVRTDDHMTKGDRSKS